MPTDIAVASADCCRLLLIVMFSMLCFSMPLLRFSSSLFMLNMLAYAMMLPRTTASLIAISMIFIAYTTSLITFSAAFAFRRAAFHCHI